MPNPSTDEFRAAAASFWRHVDSGDSDAANAATADIDRIMEHWQANGEADQRLSLLLHDEAREVRYAAAASLGPESSEGVTTLRELVTDPGGLVAPTARLLLMQWHVTP